MSGNGWEKARAQVKRLFAAAAPPPPRHAAANEWEQTREYVKLLREHGGRE